MPANHNKSLTSRQSPKTPKTTPNVSPNSYNDNKSQVNPKPEKVVHNNRFFVEDTPIELSQCHSPLSSLSIDSDDGFDDQKLLEAAISTGMNKEIKTNTFKSLKTVDENNDSLKPNKFDREDDEITYTICHQSMC